MARPKRDLPPRVPNRLAELDQAVMLLGNRAQQDQLKVEVRKRLVELVGEYPASQQQASRWKVALKGLAKEMRDMGDTASPPSKARKVAAEGAPPARRRAQRVFRASEVGR